jgi:isoquinoline 1-oxidoreductase subunit alpha
MVQLTVNGTTHDLTDVDPATPLLWVLRDRLGLIGTKFGCGVASCGACTVHMDGQPVRSCSVPIDQIGSAKIRTIEGLADPDGTLHPLQAAWIAEDVPQCGYCQAGQLMTAAALLSEKPKPSDADIDVALEGNLCRCGTYLRIRKAIHAAAAALANGGRA